MALPPALDPRRRRRRGLPPAPAAPWEPQWSFVGVSEAVIAASGDLTFDLPEGVQSGDLLILGVTVRSGEFYYLGEAWSWQANGGGLGNTTENTEASRAGFQVFACVYDAENPPETTFERVGGSLAIGAVAAYRANGVVEITPPYWAAQHMAVAGTEISVAVDPMESDRCLMVAVVAGARNGTCSNVAASVAPSGASGGTSGAAEVQDDAFTERLDTGTATAPGGSLGILDAVKTVAGDVGTVSATHSTSARHSIVVGAFRVTQA